MIDDRVHTELCTKWIQIMTDLTPPFLNRTKRLNGLSSRNQSQVTCQFTKKQLEYLKIQFTEILKINELVTGNIFYDNEQLLYLLNFVLDQAFYSKSSGSKSRSSLSKSQVEKLKSQFFQIVLKEMRQTKVKLKSELSDENMNILVGCVLKWLYWALDDHKKFGKWLI